MRLGKFCKMAQVQRKRTSFKCPLCDRQIFGVHSITRHRQNLKKHPNDISRCDNVYKKFAKKFDLLQGMPVKKCSPSSSDEDNDFNLSSDSDFILETSFDAPFEHNTVPLQDQHIPLEDNAVPLQDALIAQPMPEPDLTRIVRRAPYYSGTTGKLVTCTRIVDKVERFSKCPPADITFKQDAWIAYTLAVYRSCSQDFWTFFLPMHTLSATAIDIALAAAKEAFMQSKVLKDFPLSKRSLMHHKIAKIPSFWPLVMCTATIDLRSFEVPERLSTINFRFVDPVWAWICAAEKQPANTLQWIPKRKVDPAYPHDYYYGAGVEYGDNFAEACRTCPVGTFPMCVSLHWDGAHAHGLWATPICVGVANTNSLHPDTKFCIAYMPVLADMGAQHEGDRKEIKFSIAQQCISAILSVLEKAARSGVVCKLPSIHGGISKHVTDISKHVPNISKDVKTIAFCDDRSVFKFDANSRSSQNAISDTIT